MCMRAKDKNSRKDVELISPEQQFNYLYKFIVQTSMTDLREAPPNHIAQVCRQLKKFCQAVITAERKDSDLYDAFCQTRSLDSIYQIFIKSQQKQVMNCVVDCFSMLIVNMSQQSSIHYILSSQAVTNLLQVRFMSLDLELAEYYINFLKAISTKLNDGTVHIFLNQKVVGFPLLWQTIRFYNHPETLIRNTCRNIVLSIFKLKQPLAHKFLSSFPFVIFYSHLANQLRDGCILLQELCGNNNLKEEKKEAVMHQLDQLTDLQLYMDDLSDLCCQDSRRQLLNCLMSQWLVPMLRNLRRPKIKITTKTLMFILSTIFKNFQKLREIPNFCLLLLFGRYLPRQMTVQILTVQGQPALLSYSRKFLFKHYWDNHFDVIVWNCKYFFGNLDTIPHASQIENKKRSHSNEPKAQGYIGPTPPQQSTLLDSKILFKQERMPTELQREMMRIEQLFEVSLVGWPTERPERFSHGKLRPGVIRHYYQMQQQLRERSFIDLDEAQDNKNYGYIFELLLSDSQDLLLCCFQLIRSIVNCEVVSKQVLTFCGLDSSSSHNQNLRRILWELVQLFVRKGGCFQIDTYREVSNLIKNIAGNNDNGLFDSFAVNHLSSAMKLVIDRLVSYACNIKDYCSLLQAFTQAQESVKNVAPISRIQQIISWLCSPSDGSLQGYIELSSQIRSDFAIFVLLVSLKTKYMPGGSTQGQLITINRTDMSASSMLGKEIQFPQSQVQYAEFKEPDSNQSFKCFVLANKVGFMLSEKVGSSRGRIVINCQYNQLTCEQKENQLKKTYMTFAEPNRRTRSFVITFDNSKVAQNFKKNFDTWRQEQARDTIAAFMKNLNRCLHEVDTWGSKLPDISFGSEVLSEAETEQPTTNPKLINQNCSLIDMCSSFCLI